MDFYHFTDERLLEVIEAEGLRPGNDPYKSWLQVGPLLPRENGIWFSTDPAWNLSNGLAAFPVTPEIRITVDIDPKDPRLLKWTDVLRDAGTKVDRKSKEYQAVKTFYVYLGAIPPDRIKEIVCVRYTFPDGSIGRTYDDVQAYKERKMTAG